MHKMDLYAGILLSTFNSELGRPYLDRLPSVIESESTVATGKRQRASPKSYAATRFSSRSRQIYDGPHPLLYTRNSSSEAPDQASSTS